MPNLEDFRKDCGEWEEEDGCMGDYPEECPMREACKKDAEGTNEELASA